MARPMILSDETRPTDYTFANSVAVHVQTDQDMTDGSTPDELARTIQSHLWLANLEISSGIAPAVSSTSQMPRQPHPDGPTTYLYECYLKSQINSARPPSGCDLSTVWSLQVDLDKDLPRACSLALTPSL